MLGKATRFEHQASTSFVVGVHGTSEPKNTVKKRMFTPIKRGTFVFKTGL